MLIFMILFIIVALIGAKPAGKSNFFDDYMSKPQTSAVNGIFTMLIFFSHISTYFKLTGTFDAPYASVKDYLSQLVVVSFLFYSGYGIMESVKKKGLGYVKSIPAKRFFKVLYHMDLAVLIFIAVNLVLGNKLTLSKTLLAFIGWTSLGNSNWYIFVVLALYLIVFVSFMISRGNKYVGTVLTSVLTLALVIALKKAGKDTWWYNTALLYPTGMIFSLIKERFEKIVMKNDVFWFGSTLCIFIAYNVFEHFRKSNFAFCTMWAIMFATLIVVITMKIKIGNAVLDWLGAHVFSVYMLQRVPMMILSKLGLAQSHRYIYVVLCLAITLALAALFDKLTGRIDTLIYTRKKKAE